MLPGALLRARVEGQRIRPVSITPGRSQAAEAAELVFTTWAEGAARAARMGDVAADIEELCAERTDGKLVRGLSKVCADRAVTDTPGTHARTLRAEVFRRAAAVGPLALTPGPLGQPTAGSVLGSVEALTADALYADLPAEQRVRALRVPDARWLINRYNVAACQAVLVHATELLLTVHRPTAPRLRQLFRWAKFHQLLCAAVTNDEGALVVRFDGPASVLGGSTRYGQQLARFLPAVLLGDGWTLRAQVAWTRRRLKRTFELSSEDGLRTHLRDDGAWRGKTQAALVAGFAGSPSGWTLSDGDLPLQIGPRELCFPDFVLSDGRASIKLDLLGYWRSAQITRRLDAMDRYGCRDLLIAVSRRLCAEPGGVAPEDPRVIVYSDVLPVQRVTAAATRCASVRASPGAKRRRPHTEGEQR